jgi:hypothetical protein
VIFRLGTVGGNVECDGAQFINPGQTAFQVDATSIKGFFLLRKRVRAQGLVRLYGTRIDGNLECDGATFINPKAFAFEAERAEIKGYVYLRHDFRAEGAVRLIAATIGGDLVCNGQFINPGGDCLNAASINIVGSLLFRNCEARGSVKLIAASIGRTFECDGSKLVTDKGDALSAFGIRIDGNTNLGNGFEANGTVIMASAGSHSRCNLMSNLPRRSSLKATNQR